MHKINQSRKWMIAAAVIMFLIMLVCNMLTDMCTDDFHYLYNFKDNTKRIASISDIIPSMQIHAYKMNGRLIAHALAQLFLMLPAIVFDVVNSLMFTLQVYIIYRLGNGRRERSVFLFVLIFFAIWLFELAFGQVNLWLVGSCNYMWGAVVCLLFLLPYLNKLFYDIDIKGKFRQAIWLILSFIAGAYIENASAAMIFCAFLLGCYMLFIQKRKARIYYIAAPLVAFAGYIWMMSAPYMRVAGNEFSLWNIVKAVGRSGNMFYKMWPIILGFAVLFTIGCLVKLHRDVLSVSVIFAVTSIFSEVIMIFAEYNVERRAFYTFVLLLAACSMLFVELIREEKYRVLLTCLGVCLLLAGTYYLSLGICDIALTHRDVLKNQAYIAECRENGQMEIVLPEVKPRTHYSALSGLQYLRTDSTYWLNKCMARYYGVEKITKASAD